MHLASARLVWFSPTGTTKAVARAIAEGVGPGRVESTDITSPTARKRPLRTSSEELLIIAVPVYMGRVPALLDDWLHSMEAHDTPTVCVVVYGNRAYENALLELKDVVTGQGCVPVAGAAYIGEHSFSEPDAPVALGRPDEDDLENARAFGRRIRERLRSVAAISELPEVQVPGARPYGGVTVLWDVDFIEVNDRCEQCGVCAETCPVGAVDPQNSAVVDQEKCITCCACIKRCPRSARSMKQGPVKEAQKRLVRFHGEPRRPECFLA